MPRSIATRITLTLAALIPAASGAHAAWSSAQPVCSLRDVRINEASGIVLSARHPGIFYLHNDSGDEARFFAVNKSGQTVATVSVADVEATDWEDIAAGTNASGRPVLFLADFGDNLRGRPFVTIYMVPEPDLKTGALDQAITAQAHPIRFRYPDGPRNAETLLFDPRTRALYVVTKEEENKPSLVFRVEVRSGDQTQVARKVGEISFSDPLPMYPNLATGGDISPDGSRLIVRSYQQAYEWDIPEGYTLESALKIPPRIVALPLEQQGEAIAYGRDNRHLMCVSEGLHPTVFLLKWGNFPMKWKKDR